MKKAFATMVVLGCSAMSAVAFADPPAKAPGVTEVRPVDIVARPAIPRASIDIARLQPKATLSALRQPFLDRIEKAIERDPF